MDDQSIRISAKTAEAEVNFAKLEGIIKKQSGEIIKLGEAYKGFNKEGNLTEVVLKGLTDANKQYELVLKRTVKANGELGEKFKQSKEKLREYNTEVKDAIKAQKELEAAQRKATKEADANAKKLAASRRGQSFGQVLINQFGPIRGNADPQQKINIQQSIASAAQLVASGRVTEQVFSNVFSKLETQPNALFTGMEAQAALALRRIQNSFAGLDDVIEKNVKQLFTLRGVIRLFAVQAFHQAFNLITGSALQTLRTVSDLSIKIAEIQTITQDAELSTSSWSKSLRQLSDDFGLDIIDVAKSAYDALSNQVVRATEVTDFLSKAAVFGKTTSSSLTDSVNLLSSALNSYKSQGLTTQRASEVLFTTIDLGRITASELANTFGNVLPNAAQVGLSFEEIAATLTTLTRQGIQADTAMTLVNNILLKLIKPTKEMEELFNEWGVNTGQAAVKTFGFQGILERLNAELQKGGAARLGDLTGEMRAFRFAAAATGPSNIKQFAEDFDKISNSAESFKRAQQIALESPGQQFIKEIQQFKNVFLFDVGQGALNGIISLSKSLGGVKSILTTLIEPLTTSSKVLTDLAASSLSLAAGLTQLAPVASTLKGLFGLLPGLISAAAIAFVAFQSKAILASIASSNLVTVLGTMFTSIRAGTVATYTAITGTNALSVSQKVLQGSSAAATVGMNAFNAAVALTGNIVNLAIIAISLLTGVILSNEASAKQARLDALESTVSIVKEQNEKITQIIGTEFEKQITLTKKGLDSQLREVRQFSAEVNKVFTEAFRPNKTKSGQFLDLDLAELKDSLFGKEGTLTVEDIFEEILDSRKNEKKLLQKISEEEFTRKIDLLTPKEQISAIADRITELKSTAVSLFNIGDIDGARDSIEEISKVVEKIDKEAGKTFEDILKDTQKLIQEFKNASSLSKKDLFSQAVLKEKQARKLIDTGNIEEARSLFTEVNALLKAAADKQDDIRKKGAKFGVEFSGSTLRSRGLKLLESRFGDVSSEKPEKLKVDVARLQLELEKQLQDQLITKAELLQDAIDEQKKLEESVRSTEDIYSQITNELRQQLETTKAMRSLTTEQIANLGKIAEAFAPGFFVRNFRLTDGDLPFRTSVENEPASQLQKRIAELSALRDKILGTDVLQRLTSLQKSLSDDSSPKNLERISKELKNITDGSSIDEFREKLEQIKTTLRSLGSPDNIGFIDQGKTDRFFKPIPRTILDPKTGKKRQVELDDINASGLNAGVTIRALQQQIDAIANSSDEIDRVINRFQEFQKASKEQGPQIPEGLLKLIPEVEFSENAQETFKRIQESVDRLKSAMDGAKVLKFELDLGPDVIPKLQELRATLIDIDRLKGAPPGGAVQRQAVGGPAGRDRMLVWRDPNEFVMNADATRKFYSQLVAMNSGMAPQRRAGGGVVNNIPITVNNQSDGGVDNVLRGIGKQLKRQVRRGTLKLG